MNTQEDKIIKQFFNENKQEIPDTFFSRKVMQKIPERRKYEWLIILLAGLASLISFVFGKFEIIRPNITIPDITITVERGIFVYILAGIVLIPFITLIFYFFKTGNKKLNF